MTSLGVSVNTQYRKPETIVRPELKSWKIIIWITKHRMPKRCSPSFNHQLKYHLTNQQM